MASTVLVRGELGYTIPGMALLSVLIWVLLMFGREYRRSPRLLRHGATALRRAGSLAGNAAGELPYFLLMLQGVIFAFGWLLTSPANPLGMP